MILLHRQISGTGLGYACTPAPKRRFAIRENARNVSYKPETLPFEFDLRL
jgi:hypothetical protein